MSINTRILLYVITCSLIAVIPSSHLTPDAVEAVPTVVQNGLREVLADMEFVTGTTHSRFSTAVLLCELCQFCPFK